MAELIIACLSQKGGVGKSTLARLIARTYASGGWRVKIADFNTKQLTSVDWVNTRKALAVEPVIDAEPYTGVRAMRREPYDLVVVDGKPDSDQSSLEIARIADLVVLPCGLSIDDIKPQLMFAAELAEKGVPKDRLFFVLTKVINSDSAARQTREVIVSKGFPMASQELSAKTSYQNAQNAGKAVSETTVPSLNEMADALAAEIVARVTEVGAQK